MKLEMEMETEKVKRLTREEFLEKGYADLWLDFSHLPKFRSGTQSWRELSNLIYGKLYRGFLWDWMKTCTDLCCPREPGWHKFYYNVILERGRFSCRIVTKDRETLDCYAEVIDSPDGPQLFNADWGAVITVRNAMMEMRRNNPDCITEKKTSND